jgi:type IV secretion system protein VirB10
MEQVLLIPRGSKLLATYDNELLAGQSRVLIAFTRIIFPDGRSVTLPGLGATDRQGEAGLSDQVDNHTRHTFGSAVLLSLISAAAQLTQPRTGSSVFAPANPGQVAAGAMGQELADVASQIMRRNLEVVPTLVIRPGTPCNVFLASDLVFAGPYVDERVAR